MKLTRSMGDCDFDWHSVNNRLSFVALSAPVCAVGIAIRTTHNVDVNLLLNQDWTNRKWPVRSLF